jgi:hypothetical protein
MFIMSSSRLDAWRILLIVLLQDDESAPVSF